MAHRQINVDEVWITSNEGESRCRLNRTRRRLSPIRDAVLMDAPDDVRGRSRLRCTPTSTPGHAASNCTLPPKIVHGVDQATTGMVRPVHVCCGVVFLATPVDGVDGVPARSKRCASV